MRKKKTRGSGDLYSLRLGRLLSLEWSDLPTPNTQELATRQLKNIGLGNYRGRSNVVFKYRNRNNHSMLCNGFDSRIMVEITEAIPMFDSDFYKLTQIIFWSTIAVVVMLIFTDGV